jgi:hypothetical protein
VLPDLRTLLLESLSPAAVTAAAGAHLPSAARQQVQWVNCYALRAPGKSNLVLSDNRLLPIPFSLASWDNSIDEQLVAQLMQQGQQQHGAAAGSRQLPVRLSNLEHLVEQLCQL